MLIFDPGFPVGDKDAVLAAAEKIRNKLSASNPQNLPSDLSGKLPQVLEGSDTYPCPIPTRSVMIAYDARTDGPYAYTGGTCIWLCRRSLAADRPRLAAVLFHELVHVMCGWELDAEFFENFLFRDDGATPPDDGDLDSFAKRNWEGRWIRVVQSNGALVVRNASGIDILSLRQALPEFLDRAQPEALAAIPKA